MSARRVNPYSFTMNFSIASKVHLGTPLRMKGVQIGRVGVDRVDRGHGPAGLRGGRGRE
jgi:ABC-type transporter Mla subunit MlaD